MPPAEHTPPPVPAIDYIARWRDIVERRRVQMESAYERAGLTNVDYWGRRAKAYRTSLHERMDEDPFLLRLLRDVTPDTTVLDVGAGTGRHTVALAPHVSRVTAVDPSEPMLDFLRQDVATHGMGNVETVSGEWMSVEVPPADIVICSHVLYPIADVAPFIQKLAAFARQRVYVYLRVDPLATDLGFWADFYGEPLQSQPVYLDFVGVLAQLDIIADVEIVEHRFTWTFKTVDEAVDQVGNSLCLREDDVAARTRLRALLNERLISWPDGRLGPRIGSARSAILSWVPAAESAAG